MIMSIFGYQNGALWREPDKQDDGVNGQQLHVPLQCKLQGQFSPVNRP